MFLRWMMMIVSDVIKIHSNTVTCSFFIPDDFDLISFQMINGLPTDVINREHGLPSMRMSCFVHTLQLSIRDGLENVSLISKIMDKCRNLSRFTHQSTKIADLLDQIKRHIQKPTVTRWNSDYMLLKSILSIPKEQLESICNLIEYSIQFSGHDFAIMTELVDILEPFYQISVKCQAEKVVTISLVVPSIVHLICHLRSIKDNVSSCQKLVQQLQAAIETRFAGIVKRLYQTEVKNNDPFNDPVYFMAVLLDPSFKFFWIRDFKLSINDENRLKQTIIQFILDEINKDLQLQSVNSKNGLQSSMKEAVSEASSSCKPKRIKLFVYDDEHRDDRDEDASKTYNPSMELDAYLSDPVRCTFSDYWLRSRYTSLKKLVTRVFSIQASSAPIERVFSHAGLILSSRRTCMNEQLFRDIVFLKANQSLL